MVARHYTTFRIESYRGIHWLMGALRNFLSRRKLRALLDMDEHELKDMGISRRDVRRVLQCPLFVDPSMELAEIARQRIENA